MSLQQRVDDFIAERNLEYLDKTEAHYRRLSIAEAIYDAANAITSNRKKMVFHSHQNRIGKNVCMRGFEELIRHETEISNAQSFEEIFAITELVKNSIPKLGNLWSYDTALRIGFNKGLLPKDVYIQAGVIKGAIKVLNIRKISERYLPLSRFPLELQSLPAHQLEFFLCQFGKD
jgi:hypothetical protein